MKFLTGTQSSFDQLVGGDNIELVSFSRIYCSLTSPEDDQMMFNYPLIKSFNYQTGLQSTEETLRFIGGDRDLVGERSTEDEKNTDLDRFFHRNIKDLSSFYVKQTMLLSFDKLSFSRSESFLLPD